jgi:hypothetical protein
MARTRTRTSEGSAATKRELGDDPEAAGDDPAKATGGKRDRKASTAAEAAATMAGTRTTETTESMTP